MVGFSQRPHLAYRTTVFAKLFSYLGFYLLIAFSLVVSVPLIVFVYLPLVVLKAIWQMATGQAKPKLSQNAKPAV